MATIKYKLVDVKRNKQTKMTYNQEKSHSVKADLWDFTGGTVDRICLAMQGTGVRSLVWEDSICLRPTETMCRNY